jgi:2-polyprenyl-6-hydroxyphenyl methylase/3-demethylubiquinone-9 3-methyltransferase
MQSKTLKWKLAQSIELRWWKNYLGDKNPTEYAAWKKQYWQNLLSKIETLKFTDGLEVLDCGCGPAGVFMAMPENAKVDAEDPLLLDYETNLTHFKQSNYPLIKFFAVPLEDFNPSKKYDLIFCMNAINHVSDINFCYDKLCSMLKPNGQLVITIDAHNHSFFKNLFRAIPGDVLHPHQYDLNEYNQFLTSRNLKIVKTEKLKSEFFFNHYLQVAVNTK